VVNALQQCGYCSVESCNNLVIVTFFIWLPGVKCSSYVFCHVTNYLNCYTVAKYVMLCMSD